MTTTEKKELSIIAVCLLVLVLFRPWTPLPESLSNLILSLSALLLMQGLLRDLYYLSKHKVGVENDTEQRKVFGLCLESSIGVFGIVIGAALLFLMGNPLINISFIVLLLLVSIVLIAGFLINDLVLDFSTMKVYKDAEHMNIIVTRRK